MCPQIPMRASITTSISIWSGVLMIILVTGGAIAILFTDAFSDRLYGTKRIFFVVMLLAYGVYRVFRIRQMLKSDRRRNADEG